MAEHLEDEAPPVPDWVKAYNDVVSKKGPGNTKPPGPGLCAGWFRCLRRMPAKLEACGLGCRGRDLGASECRQIRNHHLRDAIFTCPRSPVCVASLLPSAYVAVYCTFFRLITWCRKSATGAEVRRRSSRRVTTAAPRFTRRISDLGSDRSLP